MATDDGNGDQPEQPTAAPGMEPTGDGSAQEETLVQMAMCTTVVTDTAAEAANRLQR